MIRYIVAYPRCSVGCHKAGGPLVHAMPHAREVTPVAFSSDGSRIVSGSRDSIVRIWNTATGKQAAELEGRSRRVTSVVFSHRYIASGSGNSTVRLWGATKFQTGLYLRVICVESCLLSYHATIGLSSLDQTRPFKYGIQKGSSCA